MKNTDKQKTSIYRLTELIGNYPFKCISCGVDIFNADKFVCPSCEKKLTPNDSKAVCQRCSTPVTTGGELCATCANHEVYFTRANTLYLYRGMLKRQVLRMKFGGAAQLCRNFALAMAAFCRQKELKYDIITYVPRQKNHGSRNRSELLCSQIFDILRIGEIHGLLAKTAETKSQKELTYYERMQNIRGAFVCTKPETCAGRDVLLVDDVMTTGATVAECSRILLEAGAKTVSVLALALQVKYIAENTK